MRIRPLRLDESRAARVPADAALGPPPNLDPSQAEAYWDERYARIVGSDPGGCWAAEDDDGSIAGIAMAIVRDGIWILTFFVVHPDVHARGIGKQLIDAALTHAEGTRGAMIASSTDPKAMRRYARAGFDLRPCVAACGIVDRTALPAGLRSAPTDDLSLFGSLGREVRGAAYDPEDFALYLRTGRTALRCGDEGVAIAADGGPTMITARSEEAATDLLWSSLALAPPGGTVHVDFITAGQDWAVRTVLDAGLPLSPDGPIFTRGALGPLRPWLPAGSFL